MVQKIERVWSLARHKLKKIKATKSQYGVNTFPRINTNTSTDTHHRWTIRLIIRPVVGIGDHLRLAYGEGRFPAHRFVDPSSATPQRPDRPIGVVEQPNVSP